MRLSKSIIGPQEISAVQKVLERGYLGMGTEVQKFEQELTEFLGGGVQVTCVNTGTAALQLAVESLQLNPGDEILVPSLTFVASYQAITAAGAVPIACDVRLEDGLIDLDDARKRITPRTRAIMPVHYASSWGDIEAVYAFAREHQLRVIEDAAHSFGCVRNGRPIGSEGDILCFSFDGIKNITSGEGGAVVTRDAAVTQYVQDARLLGVQKDTEKRFNRQRSWDFDVVHQGWRYHMSDIMAAIGRAQLARFTSDFKSKRVALSTHYRELLSSISGVKLLERPTGEFVPHIQPIRVLNHQRDRLRETLTAAGIESGIHYKPNHLLTFFKREGAPFPNTEALYAELLTLPLQPDLELADVERVVALIRETLER